MQERTEGKTSFVTESDEKISADMPVFYNPVMKLNRDTTLLVLAAMENAKDGRIRIGLVMEASGIRAARILNELVAPGHFSPKSILVNDRDERAVVCIRENVARNLGDFPADAVEVTQRDAVALLREKRWFEYLDIDPFGTPNPFLDAAVQRVARNGILAVTATDTAALAGTYPRATRRNYDAAPTRSWLMHEAGLRILIRKMQVVAAQYDVALSPILSLSTDHYYRVFFRVVEGAKAADAILAQHRFLHVDEAKGTWDVSDQNVAAEGVAVAGPLWTGPLHDAMFATRMRDAGACIDAATFKELIALLDTIIAECAIDTVGFVDSHLLAKRLGRGPPRTKDILEKLKGHGAPTHLTGVGIKTDLSVEEIERIVRDD